MKKVENGVAFVFDAPSPHLERIIETFESAYWENCGVFFGVDAAELDNFLDNLRENTIVATGPLSYPLLQKIMSSFKTLVFSFASDIFVEQAHFEIGKIMQSGGIRSSRIIVDTTSAVDSLLQAKLNSEVIELIPWSFGLKNLSFSHSSPSERPKVLLGRALEPRAIYNPMLFVRIMSHLTAHFEHLEVSIFRDGLGDDIEEPLRNNSKLSVSFLPHLSQLEYQKLLITQDAFFQTNNHDGLSVSMLQAMALGVPVFSTPTAGALDAIEDGISGTLIYSQDICSASEKVAKILKSPKLHKNIAINANVRFKESFIPEKSSAMLIAVSTDLIGDG